MSKGGLEPPVSRAQPEQSILPQQDDFSGNQQGQVRCP